MARSKGERERAQCGLLLRKGKLALSSIKANDAVFRGAFSFEEVTVIICPPIGGRFKSSELKNTFGKYSETIKHFVP